jgi:hypothetical protein
MSSALLEKLKVKPNAKKIDQIKIKLNQPQQQQALKLNTKIVDKTKNSDINASEMLAKFKTKNLVSNVNKNKQPKKVDIVDEPEPEPEPTPVSSKKTKKVKKISLKTINTGDKDNETGSTKNKKKTKKPVFGIVQDIPDTMVQIGDTILKERLPPDEKKVLLRASAYYMNNREAFINFINVLFKPYKKEFEELQETASCDNTSDTTQFSLLTHQKLVRDYLNVFTPYRGLLLYHGLGSGKTCSSIAIAEGMKNDRQIIVMTPASLRVNYLEELKKCGDPMYKKNQYWEFVKSDGNTELENTLSNVLQLPIDFIKKIGGAWLVNVTKETNFNDLDSGEKKTLDMQLNEMIINKYKFINYNGLRNSHLRELTLDYTINPFDNKVIIIDEAHNFISRIVNKITREESLSMRLYNYLLSADNCKIVLLSGTPIINYPNELGIMFNILRGFIKTWKIPLQIKTSRKINKDELNKILSSFASYDYVDYKSSTKILTITRNPFGFVNKISKSGGVETYKGVSNYRVGKKGEISDDEYIKILLSILKNNDIDVIPSTIKVELSKALPDTLDNFKTRFIKSDGSLINGGLLKRRILGLSSYFRSAQESLMPSYTKEKNLSVVKIEMSDYQFGMYEQARIQERALEKQNKKKAKKMVDGLYEESVSTYRIFSRAFCNFAFPENKRPFPKEDQNIQNLDEVLNSSGGEDILDAVSGQEKMKNPDGAFGADDADLLDQEKEVTQDKSYEVRINEALSFLKENEGKYLSKEGLETYSPKFLHILENLQDKEYRGLHLIYSQFRTLEGVGILKLVLEANGFTQFKIKQVGGSWILDIPQEDRGKPTFALYTGTETPEEKEIIRNIFNSTWNLVPESILTDLRVISSNNLYGEIIKVLMITASGAEGISLKNTRFVHIVEPYWHPVRVEQVIGRARRICSHQDLPEELRTVQVFTYLMTFQPSQIEGDKSIELRLHDTSKIDGVTPLSSDEALFEISNIKEEISKQLLKTVKESSIDCAIYNKPGNSENIQCFSFGKVSPDNFSYTPNQENEESDDVSKANKEKIKWKAKSLKLQGKEYALNPTTFEVYDYDSYIQAVKFGGDPILVGRLEKKDGKYNFISI